MAIPANRIRLAEELDGLFRAHAAQVHAICGSILRDRHEAEDAAQQVFVSAFRALLGGTEPRDPGAWLATIARRESWARARRQQTLALDEQLGDAGQEDPATLAARQDELAGIWEAIEGLPESQRDVLLLREVRGLSYDELVADLRLSHPSVRSLLSRARQSVRAHLKHAAGTLSGAPWLNVVARLFGDGPSPAVSSASRAAAVGLGALVLTGGAAVVPDAHHTPRGRQTNALPRRVPARRAAPTGAAAAAPPAPIRRAAPVASIPAPQSSVERRSGGDHGSSDRGPTRSSGDGRGSDSGTSSGSSGDGGPGPRTTATSTATAEASGTSDGGTTISGTSGSDGGGGSSSSSGLDGGGGSSGSSDSGGGSAILDGGSSGSDGGN